MGNYIFNCHGNRYKNIKSHKDVEEFSFNHLTLSGIAPEDGVYDGDTFKFITHYKGELIKLNVRCYGYDSPEMKIPKSVTNSKERDFMKIEATSARDFLKNEICNKKIKIKCLKNDKYGRVLATVSSNTCNDINQKMIDNWHGVPYYGGTKE